MNIRQAVKMAWKSIVGKKGRSILTMLGVIIGIAAVMTIVATMNGYTVKTMEQYSAMGSNKITVDIYRQPGRQQPSAEADVAQMHFTVRRQC